MGFLKARYKYRNTVLYDQMGVLGG